MRPAIALTAFAIVLLGGATTTLAQDTAAGAPGPDVLALLPAASALGAGWERVADPARLVPDDAFRDGAIVAYGGPAGARVVLAALRVTAERVAVRAAWEAAGELYDDYRTELTYDDGYAEQLANLPPPPGCAEAKRIEGAGERDLFPTGVTLCAADPDVILLAVASGTIAGATGYPASDAVVAAALAGQAGDAAGTATPGS